jgi:hypothetical protein
MPKSSKQETKARRVFAKQTGLPYPIASAISKHRTPKLRIDTELGRLPPEKEDLERMEFDKAKGIDETLRIHRNKLFTSTPDYDEYWLNILKPQYDMHRKKVLQARIEKSKQKRKLRAIFPDLPEDSNEELNDRWDRQEDYELDLSSYWPTALPVTEF